MDAGDILKDLENETKEIKKWSKKKVSEKDYFILGGIIIGVVFLFFIYINFIPKPLFENKTSIEVIEINGECEDCMNLGSLIENIFDENIDINKKILNYQSEEAELLIEKYNLKRVPALIVISKNIGEFDLDEQFFSVKDNYAVFDKAVPYIDINSKEIHGLVNLKEIYDSNCKNCMPLSSFQQQLEKVGIKIKNYQAIDSSSDVGKELINNNDLTFLPSLLVGKEIEEYWWIFEQISNSFNEKENYYVFKNPVPPYKQISTGNVKGIVDIIYLTDNSCEDCFNVTNLKNSFMSLGIFINNEKYFDVSSSEGEKILKEYNINAIPTIILSNEIQDYESIKEVLEQIGTFEKDNKFVFRKLESLNVKFKEI